MTFGSILNHGTFQFKTSVDCFWATVGKIRLLRISTSGNTGSDKSFYEFDFFLLAFSTFVEPILDYFQLFNKLFKAF